MRLGQLSRRLDLKPQEIKDLIRKQFQVEIDMDLNTRLEEEHVNALTSQYPSAELAQADLVAASTSEKSIVSAENKLTESLSNNEIQTMPETLVSTETNDENDAFIPRPVDPDAELIKAPKIKLDGLKVVGKIDLPQPKVIAESEAENAAQSDTPKSFKERRLKNQPVVDEDEEYSIYKDKKGIYHFSQTQRESRKNSLERIAREKQEKSRKQNKAKYYQQVTGTKKEIESPAKKAKKQAEREAKNQPAKQKPKGVWGKFVNWLKG